MNIRLGTSKKRRRYAVIRWCIFSVIIWTAFIFTTTGSYLKPNILIPVALCISMSEDELVSAFVGLLCGLLTDAAFGKLTGFSAILLLIFCVVTSLLFKHLLRQNIINIFVLTMIFSAVYFLLDYFFNYIMWNYEYQDILFKNLILPEYIATLVSTFLMYPIIRFIRKHFTLRTRYVLEENEALIKD